MHKKTSNNTPYLNLKKMMGHGQICNAPFINMYFRQDGNVTPCCFNTEYILGKYPDQSIDEIWNSESAKQFRRYMNKYDLSHGCHICQKHINSNNFSRTGINYYTLKSNKIFPVKFEFELSHQCNLSCIMCSQSPVKNKENEIYGDDFIQQIRKYVPHIREVSYFGGEPFSIDINYKLWKEFNSIKPDCTQMIQTNGTYWNEDILKILKNGNFNISISLDAVEKDLYEKIRVNAHFEATLKNIHHYIDYLQSRGKKISVTVCPLRLNAEHIPEIIRFTSKHNADIFFHTVWLPPNLSLINHDRQSLQYILEVYNHFICNEKNTSIQNKEEFLRLQAQIISFIRNWQKSDNLIFMNKDYYSILDQLLQKINDSNNEIHILQIKNKLNAISKKLLPVFPVAYGIKKIIESAPSNKILEVVQTNDMDLLSEYFTNYTLSSML